MKKNEAEIAATGGARRITWKGAELHNEIRREKVVQVRRELEGSFRLLEEQDMPFVMREHARKFQWGCSHCSVWQRV